MRLHHVRRGSGEPLVLVHGHGDTHRLWRPVLGRLARHHECLAVDLPGFGGSLSLRDRAPTPEAYAHAVAAFMRAQGHDTFHVAGNSLGGGVALLLGRAGTARTVCAISPIGFAEGWERRYLALTQRLAQVVLGRVPHALFRPPAVRRLALKQYVWRGDRLPYADFCEVADELALAPAHVPATPHVAGFRWQGALQCPATIAWGDRDLLLLAGPQSRRARERLPDARHVRLRGCGHLPTWDDPEQVAEAIVAATRSPRPREPAAGPAATRRSRA